MWSRTGLRVILHAEHRVGLVPKPGQRLVVQICVSLFNIVGQ